MLRQPNKRKAVSCEHLKTSRTTYEGLLGTGVAPCDSHLVCLGCGLRSSSLEQHEANHGTVNKPGHEVVLDKQHTELYCTHCADYVYDKEFDMVKLAMRSVSLPATLADGPTDQDPSVSQPAASAAPAAEQIPVPPQTCGAGPSQPSGMQPQPSGLPGPPGTFHAIGDDGFPAGLRGLNNMGNTCFMNSVLQGLLHAPLLRNYYLLGHHCKQACPITADGGFCVSCELDEVFNEAYSGARTAYSPAQFLYTWWMLAGSHLGSYQQHDAHEFLLFVLEMLNCTPGAGNISSKVFGGMLRSDVICSSCGHASTTQDPFTHLSLDVPPREQLIPLPILPRPAAHAGGSKAVGAGRAAGKGGGTAPKAAAAARNNHESAAATAPPFLPALPAATPVPSSSADHCTSSDVEICDEAAGSTLLGPLESGCFAAAAGCAATMAGVAGAAQGDTMSQLEAASAVGGAGVLVDDSEDAAQDTLSSPRMAPQELGELAPGGTAAQGAVRGRARGKPPIPKAGRGGKRGGGRFGQARRQSTPGEAEPGPATLAGLALEPSDVVMATQDTLAATSNVPGSQSTAAVRATGGPGAAMPPQLAGYQRWPAASLLGCLHRFVRQEELGPAERVECARCHSQHAIKQLSVRQLPPVLVLHAKRFEHPGGLRAAARKLETDLAFPLAGLDMRPFLSSSLLRARHGLQPTPREPSPAQTPASSPLLHHSPSQRSSRAPGSGGGGRSTGPTRAPSSSPPAAGGSSGSGPSSTTGAASMPPPAAEGFLYDLYAVVCHRGSFQGGHYVAYVRGGDGRWYLCDDAWVVGVDESVVKSVQAYMLFYCCRGVAVCG